MADDFVKTTNRHFISSNYEIRRENNFILTIEGLGKNNIDLFVMKAFLPKVSINVIDLRRGNDSLKFAGAATWQGGTLEILDTTDNETFQAIYNWFKQVYDSKKGGVIGKASEYKKTGYITEYIADGQEGRRWNLSGLWISDFDFGTLNAESADFKRVSLKIEIDPTYNKDLIEFD